MTTYPMTKAEAEKYRYDRSSLNPQGNAYNPARCAKEVSDGTVWHHLQCYRKPGKGPDGLYCAQHARILEARRNR